MVWTYLYSWISHSLFWLLLGVNTPLQLDLSQFVLAFARCEHTFTVGSLTVCFGFCSVWTHLYSWISHSLFWLLLGVNTPLQLDLLQFVLAFTQCEHTFTVGSLTVCLGFNLYGVNTPLQLDLSQFVLAFARCEHTFTVGSLTVCFGFYSVWTHLYSWISHSLFCLSLSVNTPLQLDLLQFVLAFARCEHTFTVGSHSLFRLSISVNTPLQLDLLQFVLAFTQCEHTFTVGSLTVCLGFNLYGVNIPLQLDLSQFVLAFARCEHTLTVGSLTVCFGFCSVWTHLYSWISHSLFWLLLGVNTPLQLDLSQFVLAFTQCEHTFTVGSLTVCLGFNLYGVNTPLQLDLSQFVLAFARCEHTFTVGSLTVCFGFYSVWTHLYSWISHSLFCLSLSVNTPLQLDLLQFVLAFTQCEHTFTVGSLTVCFGCRSVWTHLSVGSHSLFRLSISVNTPLQLDLLQFVLAFTQCEHTFTVGSLTVCLGFNLYGVNIPLQLDLSQFVLAFARCEHTFTVGSLTVCFAFHSVNTPLQLDLLQFVLASARMVWTHFYSWISHSLFWLISRLGCLVKQSYWKDCLLTPDPLTWKYKRTPTWN